jgi:hypothetical protein
MIAVILIIIAIFWVIIIIGTISDSHKNTKKRKHDKYKQDALEAAFQVKKEKHKPIIEQITSKQRDLIENADQKKLIDSYNKAIDSCQKNAFTRKLDKLKTINKQLEKENNIINKLSKYYYSNEENIDASNKLLYDIRFRKNATFVNLYIVKIKNTIDSKLYLIVGLTTENSLKKAFKNDLVVELVDELRFVEINSFDASRILAYLVGKYKPEGSLDPFAKFDNYENIIEMRHYKNASSELDNFIESISDFDLIQDRFIDSTVDQLKKQFQEYGFHEYFSEFLNLKVMSYNSSNGIYTSGRVSKNIDPYSQLELNLESIIKFFYYDIYLECNKEFKNTELAIKQELDLIQNNFDEWKERTIHNMEVFVDDSRLLTDAGLNYFDDEHPLSPNFENFNSISLLQFPWHQTFYGYGFEYDGEYIEINDLQPFAYIRSKPKEYSASGYASIEITREILKKEFESLKNIEEISARSILINKET